LWANPPQDTSVSGMTVWRIIRDHARQPQKESEKDGAVLLCLRDSRCWPANISANLDVHTVARRHARPHVRSEMRVRDVASAYVGECERWRLALWPGRWRCSPVRNSRTPGDHGDGDENEDGDDNAWHGHYTMRYCPNHTKRVGLIWILKIAVQN